jgi:hypothetical protein
MGIECGLLCCTNLPLRRADARGGQRQKVDRRLCRRETELAGIAEKLRKLVKKTVADTKESVNPWKIPTFQPYGPMCFFMVGKKHVTFGFLRGTSLRDPAGLLEGTGKNLRHVKLRTVNDLGNPALDPSGGASEQKGTDGRHETQEEQEIKRG